MIGAPNTQGQKYWVGIVQWAPETSVSEEIADIFRNYNIDMATTAIKIDTQWIYWKNNAGIKTNIDDFCVVLLSGFSETFIDLIMNRIYYLP